MEVNLESVLRSYAPLLEVSSSEVNLMYLLDRISSVRLIAGSISRVAASKAV